MNILKATTLGLFFVSSLAFANDTQNKVDHKTEVSKNPITGTETTTKKYSKKIKAEDGSEGEVNIKEKTKRYKDGSVKKTTDAEAETTHK